MSSQHLALDLGRVFEAYTQHTDIPYEASLYYWTISVDARMAKTGIYVALTLVSDAVFVSLS